MPPMKNTLCAAWLALVFVVEIPTASSQIEVQAEYDFEYYKVIRPYTHLRLNCTVSDPGFSFEWMKDGQIIEEESGTTVMFDGFTSELVIKPATHMDAGLYLCTAKVNDTAHASAEIHVISSPTGVLEEDTFIAEDDTLLLDCHPSGVPLPNVYWIIENTTYTESAGRVQLLPNEENVVNAVVRIDGIMRSERGEYKCVMSNVATQGEEVYVMSMVRVKDKYAIVWPIVGIVAEVVVLIVFLCVYERMREKDPYEGIIKDDMKKDKMKEKMQDRMNSRNRDSRL